MRQRKPSQQHPSLPPVYDSLPEKPQRPLPPNREGERSRSSLVPVAFVVGCLVMMALLIVACAGPAGLYVLLAIAGVAAFAMLHYLLWGAWLAKSIRQAEADARDTSGDGDRSDVE